MTPTDICPNPKCKAPITGAETCPECGLPLFNTAVFYPAKWKNVLLFPAFTVMPVIITWYMIANGLPLSAGKWAIVSVFWVGWIYYFWMFATNRLLDLYVVSREGLHIVSYAKSKKIRHIAWRDIANVLKATKSSSKSMSIYIDLKSKERITVSDMLHDTEGILAAIELYYRN